MAIKKISTAILISGRGSNLKNLIFFSKRKNSPIKIDLVISDNFKAKGLAYAKENYIPYKIIKSKNRKIFEDTIKKEILGNKIEFICLAGFMKILSKNFVNRFKNKIVNIHPSLLPKYKGLNTHKKVLENKDRFSGCTVHFVNENLDSGKIILQQKIKVSKKDNIASLKKKILKIEHKIYPKAIIKILK